MRFEAIGKDRETPGGPGFPGRPGIPELPFWPSWPSFPLSQIFRFLFQKYNGTVLNTGCTYIETIHTRQTTETFFALFSISALKLFLTLTMSGVHIPCAITRTIIYIIIIYIQHYILFTDKPLGPIGPVSPIGPLRPLEPSRPSFPGGPGGPGGPRTTSGCRRS